MMSDHLTSKELRILNEAAEVLEEQSCPFMARKVREVAERLAVPPNAVRYWDYLDKYAVEHVTEASDFLVKLMCDYADRGTQLSEARASMIGTAVDFMSQWTMMQRPAVTKEPPLPDEREDPCHPDFIAPLVHETSAVQCDTRLRQSDGRVFRCCDALGHIGPCERFDRDTESEEESHGN